MSPLLLLLVLPLLTCSDANANANEGEGNRLMSQSPPNAIEDLANLSPVSGFSKHLSKRKVLILEKKADNSDSAGALPGPVFLRAPVNPSNIARPLNIAVPVHHTCPQFLNVSYDPTRNKTDFSGLSIDIFKAVVKRLPYHLSYEFVPFYSTNNEVIELLEQVNGKVFDAAVGDIQILESRYAYVEFSQPYIQSGIVMLAKVKPDGSAEAWMFTGVFTKELWLLMAVMHLAIAFVIWFIERKNNPELQGFGAMLWFSVTVLFFTHREPVKNHWARLVLGPWLLVILIASATFTASLSSMMTVSKLEPSAPDIQTLLKTNAIVGSNRVSFLTQYLIDVLNFKPENIKAYDSIDDFPQAFENDEIEAAFTSAPHAKVFLATYCEGYMKAGPTLKLGGYAFAFPKGSALAVDISQAILKVIESGEVQKLEEDMLSTINCGSKYYKIQDDQQVGPRPFFGLFYICCAIAIFSLLITVVEDMVREFKNWRATPQQRRLWASTRTLAPENMNRSETFANKGKNTVSTETQKAVEMSPAVLSRQLL